jgi:hypothetical protein
MALILLGVVLVVACTATEYHYNAPVNTPLVMLQRRGGAVETPAGATTTSAIMANCRTNDTTDAFGIALERSLSVGKCQGPGIGG